MIDLFRNSANIKAGIKDERAKRILIVIVKIMKLLTRKNNRLKNYDYSENGWYFITVCSKGRKNIFGEYDRNIVGTGLAPVRYKNNIKLSELILIIDKRIVNKREGAKLRTAARAVPTIYTIIGSFKSKTSVEYFRTNLAAFFPWPYYTQ